VHRLFDPVIAHSARLGAGLDWKTSLQELTAAGVLGVPEYHVDESGPDHQKSFRAQVRVGGRVYGSGKGRSKKEAEQQAAEAAWSAISKSEAGTQDGDAGSGGDATGRADTHPGNHRAGGNGAGARTGTRARGAAQASTADHGTGAGQDTP
jgi:ribonuclease-3